MSSDNNWSKLHPLAQTPQATINQQQWMQAQSPQYYIDQLNNRLYNIEVATTFEEAIKREQLEIEEAKREVLTYEPLTQEILGIIRKNVYKHLMIHKSLEIYLSEIGRDINNQVKTVLFSKKLEDIIND